MWIVARRVEGGVSIMKKMKLLIICFAVFAVTFAVGWMTAPEPADVAPLKTEEYVPRNRAAMAEAGIEKGLKGEMVVGESAAAARSGFSKSLKPGLVLADGLYITLDEMKAELWKDGVKREYKIGAIRAEGHKYDTPRGEFSVLHKELNHLSTIYSVWMPYSIHFKDDFFIHGELTWNDAARTPVAGGGKSGGCVRMSTENMKEIYALLEIGDSIVVR